MKDNIKYYKLEDLKVGMRVSMGSLSKIYDTRICLDDNTIEYIGGDVFGTIVYIGNDDFTKHGINIGDVCVVMNHRESSDFAYLKG